MTAQIIFIFNSYKPSIETLKDLEHKQIVLSEARATLLYQTREMSNYDRVLIFQRYHHSFRNKMRLIKGEKDE